MLVRILRTVQGAPEGHTVFTYEAGSEIDLADSLVQPFLEAGAIELLETAAPVALEVKAEPVEPEPEPEPVEPDAGKAPAKTSTRKKGTADEPS